MANKLKQWAKSLVGRVKQRKKVIEEIPKEVIEKIEAPKEVSQDSSPTKSAKLRWADERVSFFAYRVGTDKNYTTITWKNGKPATASYHGSKPNRPILEMRHLTYAEAFWKAYESRNNALFFTYRKS